MQLARAMVLSILMLGMAPAFGAVSAGLVVGDPTGLSLKSWHGQHAYNFGLGWQNYGGYYYEFGPHYYYRRNSVIHVTADYVKHNYNVFHLHQGKLPAYYGIGVSVFAGDGSAVGVRIPLGLDYIFAHAPLDVFVELAPTMYLAPGAVFDMGGAAGVRYRFD